VLQEEILVEALLKEGQEHLFAGWPPAGQGDDGKRRLLEQLRHLDRNYAGGLCKYIQNARKLLHDSKEGARLPQGPSDYKFGAVMVISAHHGRSYPARSLPSPRSAACRRQPL
jgi:hypothetical protein